MPSFKEKWCAANPNVEHIFVLPASLFVDSQQLICDGGPYKLYRLIEHDDPDDYEYFLDPPFANKTRLGCDGKAGRTMQTIAVNCRPLKWGLDDAESIGSTSASANARRIFRERRGGMSGFDPNRRDALKRIALLGAAGLVSGILPVRSARAADLTAGFVYIGPRLDWGWNQSFATAAEALKGVPNVRVFQAGYLPESTDYGAARTIRRPEPTPRRWRA